MCDIRLEANPRRCEPTTLQSPSMNYPALRDLVRQRRTVRAYRAGDIDLRAVEQAIEDACWAPSAHHSQPWRFALATSEEARQRLAAAMGERWQEDLSGDELSPRLIEGQLKGSRVRLAKAT